MKDKKAEYDLTEFDYDGDEVLNEEKEDLEMDFSVDDFDGEDEDEYDGDDFSED